MGWIREISGQGLRLQKINHHKWTRRVWEITGWSSWLQRITDYFRRNSIVNEENNEGWMAVLTGSASTCQTETTFHSSMHMQIHERMGLLLISLIGNINVRKVLATSFKFIRPSLQIWHWLNWCSSTNQTALEERTYILRAKYTQKPWLLCTHGTMMGVSGSQLEIECLVSTQLHHLWEVTYT
jgi:hypothetical protein